MKAEVWTSSCESTEDGVMPSGQGEIGMARGSVMLPGLGDTAGGLQERTFMNPIAKVGCGERGHRAPLYPGTRVSCGCSSGQAGWGVAGAEAGM